MLAAITVKEKVYDPWLPSVSSLSANPQRFKMIVSVCVLLPPPKHRDMTAAEGVILYKPSRQLIMNEDKVARQTRLHPPLFVLSMNFTTRLR